MLDFCRVRGNVSCKISVRTYQERTGQGTYLEAATGFMWQDDIAGVAHFVRDCFDLMHAPVDADTSFDASSEQP